MNSTMLKDKIRHLAVTNNINFNIVLRNYMYERFIERLYESKYRDYFILKGGFYLSLLFGLNNRSTMDVDLNVKNIPLKKDIIRRIILEIISIRLDDEATIELIGIEDIKIFDEYSGYRVKIVIKIENIKESFTLDIATGDVITPREIVFKYCTLFNYKFLDLKAYNLESILAEKIETIMSKKEFNSRLKDYYDIYLIYTLAFKKIDLLMLKKALKNTFENRNFKDDIYLSFKTINNSIVLRKRWIVFSKSHSYAENITYEEIMKCLSNILFVEEL